MSLKGSKTEENLKEAFAGESQANRRYLYFDILKRLVIQQLVSQSVKQKQILSLQFKVKHMSTQICIQEWQKQPETKALMK